MKKKNVRDAALGCALLLLSSIAAQAKELPVKQSDLPAGVLATIKQQSRGAVIRHLNKETENGKTTYEAELTVDGRHKDVSIDEAGNILEIEEAVSFNRLPAAVQAALAKKAGKGRILRLEVVSDGKQVLAYEAAVKTGSKKSEIKVDAKDVKLPLSAEDPVVLPGKAGRFDCMAVDVAGRRLLAAHKGAGTLDLLDLNTGKALASVAVGTAQGAAVDEAGHLYFAGDEDERKIVIVDSLKLSIEGEVKVPGPIDVIAFDSKNGFLYADHDNAPEVWVINARQRKIVATVVIPGEPEFIEYDPGTDRLYQNIKTTNQVAVIDPADNKVEATWSTLPVESPHGLAVDQTKGRLFVAGKNGKLAGIDMKSGKVFATADIAPSVDQVVLDAERGIIYCAARGFISVVKETEFGLESLGDVPAPAGAHTLAVDPLTHEVWVSYADHEHSYLRKFTAR